MLHLTSTNFDEPQCLKLIEEAQNGVNHIDVAPSYGLAEERLGSWMVGMRECFNLGCKTMERSREGASAEIRIFSRLFSMPVKGIHRSHWRNRKRSYPVGWNIPTVCISCAPSS